MQYTFKIISWEAITQPITSLDRAVKKDNIPKTLNLMDNFFFNIDWQQCQCCYKSFWTNGVFGFNHKPSRLCLCKYISIKLNILAQRIASKLKILSRISTMAPDVAAAIAPWNYLRLPSCGRRFDSQAHHLSFFQFVLLKLLWEKDEKTKRGRDLPIFFKKKHSAGNVLLTWAGKRPVRTPWCDFLLIWTVFDFEISLTAFSPFPEVNISTVSGMDESNLVSLSWP